MTGTRNTLRFVALAALCLVVASVTASGTQATTTASVSVEAALNYATFAVQASSPSHFVVSVGTDTANMVSRKELAWKSADTIRISPLAPATHYYYTVSSTAKNGRTSVVRDSFDTGGVEQANLSATTGRFLLNGVPFFPVMATAFGECPDTTNVVEADVAMGVNVLDHSGWPMCSNAQHTAHWPTAEELHGLLQNKIWWLERANRHNRNPDPNAPQPTSFDSLPELLHLQGNLTMDPNPGVCAISPAALYDKLVSKAGGSSPFVYNPNLADPGMAEGATTSSGSCLDGDRMTAVFWASFLAGVDGMEYTTQIPVRQLDGVEVAGEVKAQAKRQAARLNTLYPAIVGSRGRAIPTAESSIKAKAWSYGGNTYVVALNASGQSASAKLMVGIHGRAKVFWENRGESIVRGAIADHFRPYQVHVYRMPN